MNARTLYLAYQPEAGITLVQSPEVEADQFNAQYVYGERLTFLFGTPVICTRQIGHFVHFTLPTENFVCHVDGLTFSGVRDGRIQCMLTVSQIDNLVDTWPEMEQAWA